MNLAKTICMKKEELIDLLRGEILSSKIMQNELNYISAIIHNSNITNDEKVKRIRQILK